MMLKSFKNVLALVLALVLVMGTVGVVSADAATAEVDGGFNKYFIVSNTTDSTGAKLIKSIVDVRGGVNDTAVGTATVMPETAINKLGVAAGSVAEPLDLTTYSYDWVYDNPNVTISTYNTKAGNYAHSHPAYTNYVAANMLSEDTNMMNIGDGNGNQALEQLGAIIDFGEVAEIKYLQYFFLANQNIGDVMHIYFSEDGKTWAPNTAGGLFVKDGVMASTNKTGGYWTNITFTNPQKIRYIKLACRLNNASGIAIRAWGKGSGSYENIAFGGGNNRSMGGNTGSHTQQIDRPASPAKGYGLYTTLGGGGDAINGRTYENRSYVYANFATANTQVDKLHVTMGYNDAIGYGETGYDSLKTLNDFSIYVSGTDGDGRNGTWYEVYRRSSANGDADVNPMSTITVDVSGISEALGGLDSVLVAKNTPAAAGECIRVANIVAVAKKGYVRRGGASLIKSNTDTTMNVSEGLATNNPVHTAYTEVQDEGAYTVVHTALWNNFEGNYVLYSGKVDNKKVPVDSTLTSFNQFWGPNESRTYKIDYDITKADDGGYIVGYGLLGNKGAEGPDYGATLMDNKHFALFDTAYKIPINFPIRPKVILPNADTVVEIEDYTKLIGLDNEVISDSIASEGKAVYVYDENAAYDSSEYIKIPINVQYAGTYTFTFGASWNGKGSKPTVTVGSKTLNVDNGGYIADKNLTTSHGAITNIRTYGSNAGNIELAAGEQYITVYLAKGDGEAWKTGGVAEAVLDYVKITPVEVEWDDPDAIKPVTISSSKATVIEAEDWIDSFGEKAAIVDISSNVNCSGGKAVTVIDETAGISWNKTVDGLVSSAAMVVEIPINVEKAGKYEYSYSTSWTGGGSRTAVLLGGVNTNCDSGTRTELGSTGLSTTSLTNLRNYAYQNGAIELAAGEQSVKFVIYKGGSDSIYALLDCIKIKPYIEPAVVGASGATIQVEDWAGLAKYPAETITLKDNSSNEVGALFVSKTGGVTFESSFGVKNDSTLLMEIPINVTTAGTYTVTYGASWNGSDSKPRITIGDGQVTDNNYTGAYASFTKGTYGNSSNLRTFATNRKLTAGNQVIKVWLMKADSTAEGYADCKTDSVSAVIDYIKIEPVQ